MILRGEKMRVQKKNEAKCYIIKNSKINFMLTKRVKEVRNIRIKNTY